MFPPTNALIFKMSIALVIYNWWVVQMKSIRLIWKFSPSVAFFKLFIRTPLEGCFCSANQSMLHDLLHHQKTFNIKKFWNCNGLNNGVLIALYRKPLNSGHLRVLKKLSVIERCPLLGGNLTKIATFGTKGLVHYPMHVRYLRRSLLGGFTV